MISEVKDRPAFQCLPLYPASNRGAFPNSHIFVCLEPGGLECLASFLPSKVYTLYSPYDTMHLGAEIPGSGLMRSLY